MPRLNSSPTKGKSIFLLIVITILIAGCTEEGGLDDNSGCSDSDGDGVCDDMDECPGGADSDSDGDGIPDCNDEDE